MAEKKTDSFDIDPHLLQEFLAESIEAMDGLESLFVLLGEKPDDLKIIDRIFRPVHSIKGNSSFFGLVNIKNFSHAMENILQDIRNRKRAATGPIIDVLLRGSDLLRGMMERLSGGDMSVAFLDEEEKCLVELEKITQSEEANLADLAAGIRETMKKIAGAAEPEAIIPLVAELQKPVDDLLRAILPATAASVVEQANTGYRLGGQDVTAPVKSVAHFVKDLREASKQSAQVEEFVKALGQLEATAKACGEEPVRANLEGLANDFTTIHDSGLEFDDLLASVIREKFEEMMIHIETFEPGKEAPTAAEKPAEAAAPAASEPNAPERKAEESQGKDAGAAGKFLRIEEDKVDSFMSFVGELIIAGEVFAYIQKKLEKFAGVREISQEFKNANIAFSELSSNLQKSLMAVRRVPLRSAVQKLPRIVRDTAAELGKKIEFSIEGQDIQIDKSIVEAIESPLVHMVRNSVDHGVEPPEDRIAAGKEETGHIWLSAEADEENFRLLIRDDGKGLDVEAIKRKAVEKGMISADRAAHMSDPEAFQLIFGAGVSTAKKVTDVSGRGVGMDVVLSNISKLNGKVDIDSALGKGTNFRITLPMTVTLMVVDGLVARVGEDCYIIPVADVRESVRPLAGQVSTVGGKGEMLDVRGELYRLVRMYELLGAAADLREPEKATVVLVEGKAGACGLMVDELLGQQSVVLKDLGKQFKALKIVQGGAILGDGRVGLVLDIGGILEVIAE